MIVELGAFALILAFALSAAQAGLSFAGRRWRNASLRGAGEGAALVAFAAIAFAFASLMTAFVTSDFSVLNVANNSHSEKPLLYKVAAVWGSHEGSMLLWDLALTGFGAAIVLAGGGLPTNLRSVTVGVQGLLGLLFIGYTAFASNPFVRIPNPPVEGASLNPILQDPFLAIHPPFLYSGYVGFSVVFSLCVAVLIEGRVDAAFARWVRPWALAAWSLLTIGITLGSFWAYYELGWGGWWFWDPVENASFMPWLAGAALLHSAIVTEKRGALTGWTVFLGLAAFSFSMLGAFLVRSGILTSVHAFAVDPKRGSILLGILAIAAGGGLGLFAWRAPDLKPGGLFAPVSREGALVLNNLFLATAALMVMVGTLYPLIYQAMVGQPLSVGAPFYNLAFGLLMAVILVIMPAATLLSWKRADAKGAVQRLWAAALAVVGAVALAMLLQNPKSGFAVLGVGLGVWLIAGALSELAHRVRLGATTVSDSVTRLTHLPRSALGMTLAHIGVGVFVLGACVELNGRVEVAKVVAAGQTVDIGAYHLTLSGVSTVEGPNFTAERAKVDVRGPSGPGVLYPERRFYPANRQTVSQVAIDVHGASDLYVVFGERRDGPKPTWLIRAYWNPFARLIFLGPLIMALGGGLSLSDRRLRLVAGRKALAAAQTKAAT